jgi:thiamine-monophosphate kinase
MSTDRVPADLISFRAGILDYFGLGRYLAVLNLSDIAACGGNPVALLLNLGLPSDCQLEDLLQFARGVLDQCNRVGARVVGGDMTWAQEISASATALGFVERSRILRRSGARVGDSIFVSRPIGLTPVALSYCLKPELFGEFSQDDVLKLNGQFTELTPMIQLGRKLAESTMCTSCMDNTDGLGQTFAELSRESGCAFILDDACVDIEKIVLRAAAKLETDILPFALGPGADFSLVGTLLGSWSSATVQRTFGEELRIVGTVQAGEGVMLKKEDAIAPLRIAGWNYFVR